MNHQFSRQPRFLPDIPRGEIEVPNPPQMNEKPDISWFTILAPPGVMLVITILLMVLIKSVFMIISIAMTIMTLLVSLTTATTQIRKHNKKKKEREEKYLQFIADSRSELAIAKDQQVKAMNEMHPAPEECIQRITTTSNKLWEKTPSFQDFLALRVGLGSAPLELKINYTKQAIILETDPLLMEPQRLALEYEKIPNVPITVNLPKAEIVGLAGEDDKTRALIKTMLLQLVTHHGYDDVKVIILASEEGLQEWDWLKYMPHLWDDGLQVRFMLCGKAIAHQTLVALYDVMKERERRAQEGVPLPHYVFVVEDSSLLENEYISKYLYHGSGNLGISTIFMAKSAQYLPMNCKTVITLQGKSGEIVDRNSGEKNTFTPDKVDRSDFDLVVRNLAPLRIKNSNANFSLPSSITLLETFEVKTVADFNLSSKWHKNKTYMGMSVPIGAKAGGELFQLDMHETGHGPHGLVAGTTGSGKSELLQSIIISQAMNYHPHDIVFVLIDYKGGGMADVFKGMPHLVGTITNLGGNQTTRALLSIKSELQRRQRVFSEFGVNNIDKYQKLYYSKKGQLDMPAIPHLIMIADEFAELKQDQPDFMKELVSAARVGRSLGVHLILATQKPAGVVDDQIWSNSKFKLCLKVQDEADSKDVIKRPDAAMIKEPGRAYIQVGNDEIFELFQSTYSGADYDPQGELEKSENKAKRIYKVGLNGRSEQIYPIEEEKIVKSEVPSQLSAMVKHITDTAFRNGIEPLEGPWLPPLAETVYLDDLYESSFNGTWAQRSSFLSVPVGILDDPRGQRQEPLEIDFVEEGNLFIYGSPGTGKTVLLKTLCMSIAQLYSPNDAHIYIMDFGGNTLKAFEKLPHVGGVMTLEQENKINQFMLFLFRVIEERKEKFEETGSDGYVDYRSSGREMPAIVVMIDNYFALSETYEEVDEQMISLAREGTKYGIYLVATATNGSLVKYKFSVNFALAIAYQMTDKHDYDSIVGRTEGLEPTKLGGRGLVRGTPPLEFQTSLPECTEMSTDQLVNELANSTTIRATPIPMMPATVDIRAINSQTEMLAIGLANHDLQPVTINLVANPVVVVAGDPMAGKSTLLVSWVKMLHEKVEDLQVYALDSASMGIFDMMNLPSVTDLSSVDDLYELVEEIKTILDERRSQLIECKMAGGDISALTNDWKQIVFVFDRLSEFTSSSMYSLIELLERIVKQERGLKVAVLAADDTADLANNWESLAKLIRDEQTGVILGSLKEQNLFSASLPYGVQEKQLELGDGYFVVKNRYTGLRCAIQIEERKVVVTK